MTFALTAADEKKLAAAHPFLVLLVHKAVEIVNESGSEFHNVRFRVGEVLRTLAQQKANVARGVSQTLNSKHLKQSDGYSHAVDLWALQGASVSWAWPLYYQQAELMREAYIRLLQSGGAKPPVTWGGVWDRSLHKLSKDAEAEQAAYVARRRKVGRKAFADGPHFQLG